MTITDIHHNGKHCPTRGCDCHDEQSDPGCPCYDGRTPEQHTADVAAVTLARLTKLHDDLGALKGQLHILAAWADQHGPDPHTETLADAEYHVGLLLPDSAQVADAIRDIAATLPIRGLDYGADA
jgi:hypothetical protein